MVTKFKGPRKVPRKVPLSGKVRTNRTYRRKLYVHYLVTPPYGWYCRAGKSVPLGKIQGRLNSWSTSVSKRGSRGVAHVAISLQWSVKYPLKCLYKDK